MESSSDPAADFADRPWMDPESAPLEEPETEPKKRSKVKWDQPRHWQAMAHAGSLLALVLPGSGVNLLIPILIWQLKAKKEGDAALTVQAIEALNFQLNISALTVILSITIVGLPLLLVLWLAAAVFMIIAAVKAYRGEPYRYPWIYRVVTPSPEP